MSDDDQTTDDQTTDDQTTTTDTPWFSEDWRQQIAGDDEKALAQLGRYKTPVDVWNKARALEQRLSSGELKDTAPFPADGSDEAKAAWRAEHGVPDAPDKYDLKAELGDDEKKALAGFFEYAHANNYDSKVVNDMLNYFMEEGTRADESAAAADAEMASITDDALRSEWGGDYRGHLNRIDALIDTFPEGAGETLMNARLADGSLLRNNKNAMNFLLDAALAINPATTITGDGKGGTIDSVQDELAQIRDVMKTNRAKYNGDQAMQERYRTLLAAETKLKERR
jgi:hypothetical protein